MKNYQAYIKNYETIHHSDYTKFVKALRKFIKRYDINDLSLLNLVISLEKAITIAENSRPMSYTSIKKARQIRSTLDVDDTSKEFKNKFVIAAALCIEVCSANKIHTEQLVKLFSKL